MKQEILAIYDYEEDYANNLMDYLNRRSNFCFEVKVFTNESSIMEFIAKHMIDILLIAQDFELAPFHQTNIRHIMLLTESNQTITSEEYGTIYKFQSVEKIKKQIEEFYILQGQKSSNFCGVRRITKTNVFGVFSPCDGTLKTSLALLLAQRSARDKKTLYLNFENLPGLKAEGNSNTSAGLSELIYYIKQRKPNLILKINSLVEKMGNLYYISPVEHYMDLYDLDPLDIQVLVTELKEQSDYEVVIIDIGYISESALGLMEACDKVYLLTKADLISRNKEAAFNKLLRLEEKENISPRVIPVIIPKDYEPDFRSYDSLQICDSRIGSLVDDLLV